MLATQLLLGFGILLLGNLSLENARLQDNYISFNSETAVILAPQNPGKEIYADFCIQCHGANGKGDVAGIPPLAGSDWLTTKRNESIAAVKFGLSGAITVNKTKYDKNMPAMGLSNEEVADVINYVMTSWGNKQTKFISLKEVEAITKK